MNTHAKAISRSPRRKSDAHESQLNTQRRNSNTHEHANTQKKAAAHSPRRNSNAHESQLNTQRRWFI
ncbi:unnamed protein product, partial [Rotaria sp. Silwood2]